MKIYLIHPGDSDLNDLTPKGILQMKNLSRKLISDKLSFDKIYVNGHDVSRQSGNILSKSLKIPIISDERFVEITKKVILGDLDDFDQNNLDHINLFAKEIAEIGKDVIITMGGGIHRVLISALTGMPLNETRHFSLYPSGVSILQYSEGSDDGTGRWRISVLNDRTHLKIP